MAVRSVVAQLVAVHGILVAGTDRASGHGPLRGHRDGITSLSHPERQRNLYYRLPCS